MGQSGLRAHAYLQRFYLTASVARWFPLQTHRQRAALCRSYLVLNQSVKRRDVSDRARAKPDGAYEDDT
ncbi:protein of unknown function (plasmid) [Caballeronia sp. S22]